MVHRFITEGGGADADFLIGGESVIFAAVVSSARVIRLLWLYVTIPDPNCRSGFIFNTDTHSFLIFLPWSSMIDQLEMENRIRVEVI